MGKTSFREASRKFNFTNTNFEDTFTTDQINEGSFQRMADALETIAKDKTKLTDRIEYLESSEKSLNERNLNLWRSNNALRGHITRLKKQLTISQREYKELVNKI